MDNGQDMARLDQYEKIRVQGYDSVSLNNNEQHGFKAKKLYFKECHLAGRQYHDVDEVWSDLEIGTLLRLERDYNNRYDSHAVAVMFDKIENDTIGEEDAECDEDVDESTAEEFLLGYIPSGENEFIAKMLEMGWNNVFECRISKKNPEAHYENQIRLTIRIKRNEKDEK